MQDCIIVSFADGICLTKTYCFWSAYTKAWSTVSESRPLDDLYNIAANDIVNRYKNAKLLDVCTGSGRLPLKIALMNPNFEIYGLDISDAMIDIAKEEAIKTSASDRLNFRVGDVSNLCFEDEFFDIVTCTISLPHWPKPIQVLNEIYRVLKPGGEAWIYELNKHPSKEAIENFKRNYGWIVASWPLRFCMWHRGVASEWVDSILRDTNVMFQDKQIEQRDLLLILRLKKTK